MMAEENILEYQGLEESTLTGTALILLTFLDKAEQIPTLEFEIHSWQCWICV